MHLRSAQPLQIGGADGDLLKFSEAEDDQLVRSLHRRCHNGKVSEPVLHDLHGILRGEILHAQMNAGIFDTEAAQCRQQQAVQRDLGRGNRHKTGLKRLVPRQFLLASLQMRDSRRNVLIQPRTLGRERHTMV